jgi:threonine dehydratase
MITFENVAKAAQTIASHANRTPVRTSRIVDAITGATVFFKDETQQRSGAFKFRGAFNALSQLEPPQKARGVVAYSSGNHAQALALASKILAIPVSIVMPTDAPIAKLEATRAYGANIISYDRKTESREAIAAELAEKHGLAIIAPFDHPHIIAGQGTATKELIEDIGPLDRLFVCLGGGGLISGSALSAKALSPNCEIYGVEPEAGDDVRQSLRAGRIIEIETPDTIADGAQTRRVGDLTFPIIQSHVKDILTVTDNQLLDQMEFFRVAMKMVVEPTGCLAAAAVQNNLLDNRGLRVGVIVSGGNVDAARFAQSLGRPINWPKPAV